MDFYPRLSILERRKNVPASKAFDQLIGYLENSPSDLDPAFRRSSIRVIILDLAAHLSGRTDWSTDTTLRALVTLKLLGRSSIATDDLVSHLPLFTHDPNSTTIRYAFTPSIVQESLRILTNALFLHPLSRSSVDLLPALSALVEFAAGSVDRSLQTNPEPDLDHSVRHLNSFLASRVIFLITAVPSYLVIELIEKTDLVSYFEQSFKHELAKRIDPQTHSYPSTAPDVLIEHLKVIFNLMVHYPKSVIQFGQLPSPPIGQSSFAGSSTNVDCHSPQEPAVSSGRRASLKARLMNKISRRARSESSSIKEQDSLSEVSTYQDDHRPSLPKNSHPSRSRAHSKASSRVPSTDQDVEGLDSVTDPHNHLFAGFFNDDYVLPDNPPNRSSTEIPPVISKLIEIIDRVTLYCCPGDPDERSVQEKCQTHSMDLEVDLTQVILLTANLILPHGPHPDSSTATGLNRKSREALIQIIVPADIDRSVALNKQDNLIGRILRLMNSVRFESLKHTCGAFLNALYEEDTDRLTSQIGYGPLAGFLLSIGKSGINPESKHTVGPDVNPITGTYWNSNEEDQTSREKNGGGGDEMSDLEKEQEVDRMCDLFDRINKTGIIHTDDPRKIALESGRFVEIENQIDQQSIKQDEMDEINALKDLQIYKDSKKKS
ncbi:hypothetical protein KEM48_000736 [Puccinia striiformis f. sp. tritici PST-130]|nr:hypothetical protein KEM48_000736 [Puccinia striiformis f. sp. tritici PST-130]